MTLAAPAIIRTPGLLMPIRQVFSVGNVNIPMTATEVMFRQSLADAIWNRAWREIADAFYVPPEYMKRQLFNSVQT